MSRRQALILAGIAVVLAAAVGWSIWNSAEPPAEQPVERDEPLVEAEGGEVRLRLFFPGASGWLVAEERTLDTEGAGADLRTIAAEVLAGPRGERLFAPFPQGTEVGHVYISEIGIAYIDLVSTAPDPPTSGSRQEMLSVYSLVNSVLSNLPDLAGVALLWNGQQRPTFAGHLDTGRPLTEDRSLVPGEARGR